MKTIVLFMMLCQLSISFANWTESCDHYKYRQDSSEPQPGMHILCAKATGNGQINISLLKDGHEEYIFEYNSDFGDTINLLRKVHDVIGTSNGRSLDMWETYDIDGSILYSIDRIVYEGMWMNLIDDSSLTSPPRNCFYIHQRSLDMARSSTRLCAKKLMF